MSNNKTALVTGASGFIGGHLVAALLKDNYRVRCLVRKTSSLSSIPRDQVELVYGDLEDQSSLEEAVAGVDYIFHLAGRVKGVNRREFFHTNREGTVHLLRAVERAKKKPRSFIYVSSQAAAGPSPDGRPLTEADPPRPVSYYGESKLAAEEEIKRSAGLAGAVIIRPAVVYGPREKEIFQVVRLIEKGIRFRLGCRDTRLSMVYVSDLIRAILKGAERTGKGVKTYFISDGNTYAWSQILRAAAEMMGRKSLGVTIPWKPAYLTVRTLALLAPSSKAIIYLDKLREMKYKFWICNSKNATRELDFHPRFDLREGMKEAIDWYRREGWI